MAGSLDIFQTTMPNIMNMIEDLMYKYLPRTHLALAGIQVNAKRSSFCVYIVVCPGHLLTYDDDKPLQQKMQVTLSMDPSTTVKQLRTVLGLA